MSSEAVVVTRCISGSDGRVHRRPLDHQIAVLQRCGISDAAAELRHDRERHQREHDHRRRTPSRCGGSRSARCGRPSLDPGGDQGWTGRCAPPDRQQQIGRAPASPRARSRSRSGARAGRSVTAGRRTRRLKPCRNNTGTTATTRIRTANQSGRRTSTTASTDNDRPGPVGGHRPSSRTAARSSRRRIIAVTPATMSSTIDADRGDEAGEDSALNVVPRR